jgi:DeoR/GlpR family transcriptional regulator of sugar metabolism
MQNRSIPAQRRNEILSHLEKNQFVRSSTLSEILLVSEATIRRDLEILENQGVVERTHGGAMLSHHMQSEPAFLASKETFSYEKECIGAAAANFVESGDTIFINFGTTNTQVARQLKSHSELEEVTIITNNISVLLELQDSPSFNIVCLGGRYRFHSNSLVGAFTMKTLEGVYASKAFIGVDGISPKYGCTTPVETDAEISQKMIENTSGRIFVVADNSKWGVVSNFKVAALNRISTWITDDKLSQDARTILEAIPVEVVIAEPMRRSNEPK